MGGHFLARAAYPSGATPVFEHPLNGPSYILFNDGGTYRAKNGSIGSIDYSSTNATAVFQYAIDNSDGEILITAGTYSLPTIPINYDNNTWLHGEGKETTILQYTGGQIAEAVLDTPGSSTTRVNYFKISDLTVDGGNAAQYGIRTENGVGIIENNLVKNYVNVADWGIGIIWGWTESGDNTASATMSPSSGAYIRNNIVGFSSADNANPSGLVGIWVTNSFRIYVQNNIVRSLTKSASLDCRGIVIDAQVTMADVSDNRVEDIQGNSGGGMAIYVIAGGAYSQEIDKVIISNNIIHDVSRGIVSSVTGSSSNDYLLIEENIISNTDGNAIWIGSANNTVIQNNLIINPARIALAQQYYEVGILLSDAGNSTVTGNHILDNRTTHLMEYGIFEFGGTSLNNLITDNYLFGYNQAGYGNQAGGGVGSIVKNNFGFVTENSGSTSAIATGSTVNHGLASTPTSVVITPQADAGDFWVSAVATTTFTVSFDGGGSIAFYWYAEYDP